MLHQLFQRVISGDIAGVMALLAPDVVELDDGGALHRAARRPIVGPDRVARFIINLAKRIGPTMTVDAGVVNGRIGLLFRTDGHTDIVMSFEINLALKVKGIYVQLNPDKLRHLNPR